MPFRAARLAPEVLHTSNVLSGEFSKDLDVQVAGTGRDKAVDDCSHAETQNHFVSVPGHKSWVSNASFTVRLGQAERGVCCWKQGSTCEREWLLQRVPYSQHKVCLWQCCAARRPCCRLSASAGCRQSAGAQRTSSCHSSSRRGPPAPGCPASALGCLPTVSHSSRAAPGPAQPCQSLQAVRCRTSFPCFLQACRATPAGTLQSTKQQAETAGGKH